MVVDVVDLVAQGGDQAGPRCLELGLMAGYEIALYLREPRGKGDGLGAVEGQDWRLHGLIVMFGGGSAVPELCDSAGAGPGAGGGVEVVAALVLVLEALARASSLTLGAASRAAAGATTAGASAANATDATTTTTIVRPAATTGTVAVTNPPAGVNTHVDPAVTTQAIGRRQC